MLESESVENIQSLEKQAQTSNNMHGIESSVRILGHISRSSSAIESLSSDELTALEDKGWIARSKCICTLCPHLKKTFNESLE